MLFSTFKNKRKLLTFSLMVVLIIPAGCSTAQQHEEAQKKLEQLRIKKEKYANLEAAMKGQQLKQGTMSSDIIADFGKPDDIFQSGSRTGSFEIWTYEKLLENKEEEGWENIRLYFDNGKLVSWNF